MVFIVETAFDIKQILRVYQKIVDNGQKVDDAYRFAGVSAESDYDGYTLMLFDEAVSLHIFFHNSHKFEYKRSVDLEAFMEKIKHIDKLDLN